MEQKVDRDIKISEEQNVDFNMTSFDGTKLKSKSMNGDMGMLDCTQVTGQCSVDLDQGQSHAHVGQPDIETPHVNKSCQISIVSSKDTSIENSDSNSTTGSDKDDITGFTCDICQSDLGVSETWTRCTDCGYYDICNQCQGGHTQHKVQHHDFHFPSDLSSYCDGCGYAFKTRRAKYYSCTSCDNYVLCHKCKTVGMHRKHDDKLLKETKSNM